MKSVRVSRWIAGLFVLAVLTACASHDSRVKCDGRLQPINAPAAKQKSASGSAAGATPASRSAVVPAGTASGKDRP